MAKIAHTFTLNLEILKQCREQIGLTQDKVKKKVSSISAIEAGEKSPTYKQLDKLAELYIVPRWVFVAEALPEKYKYTNTPAFRKFKNSTVFEDHKVRQVIARVEQYRDLFIELRQDMDDRPMPFSPPQIKNIDDIATTAKEVRKWLTIADQNLDFSDLKEKLAQKSIFVFLTDKYEGWSHIDQTFRGLAIMDSAMPIIIINNSDSKKAQSFTLMHELGHLLQKHTGIDGEDTQQSKVEQWCDRFAGEFLMPADSSQWGSFTNKNFEELSVVKELAIAFKVSPHACLVRLKQLKKIDPDSYDRQEETLKKEYKELQNKLKSSKGGPARNRPREVCEQFGTGFVNTVLTTWHNKDMTLHKATRLLGLKRPKQMYELDIGA